MTKKLTCRAHGGYFKIEAKRGRPPVRCDVENNPCTAAQTAIPTQVKRNKAGDAKPTKKELAASRAAYEASDKAKRKSLSEITAESIEANAKLAAELKAKIERAAGRPIEHKIIITDGKMVTSRERSLEKAKDAKAQLSEQGWEVKGEAKGEKVSITGTRGDELIYVEWNDGEVVTQQYSLWSVDKPATNNRPKATLPFDPEYVSDKELAQYLVGNKITWYNRVGQSIETGTCGHDHVIIEHRLDSLGWENPAERLIKFTDGQGGITRVILLGQLMKVGK